MGALAYDGALIIRPHTIREGAKAPMSNPTAPPRRLRVTEIGEYVRHQSCARRFALGYDNQAAFKALPFSGRPYSIMDPVLAEAGKQREQDWAQSLEDLGYLALALPEREPGKGASWDDLAARPELGAPGPGNGTHLAS